MTHCGTESRKGFSIAEGKQQERCLLDIKRRVNPKTLGAERSYAHIFFASQKCQQRLLHVLKNRSEKAKRTVKSNFYGIMLVPVNVVW